MVKCVKITHALLSNTRDVACAWDAWDVKKHLAQSPTNWQLTKGDKMIYQHPDNIKTEITLCLFIVSGCKHIDI